MKKMLMNNLGLKLLSVVFAIMLWLIVVAIDDPVITQSFSPIRVTMLNEDAVTDKDKVYKIEDNSDIISITVKAKRSIIDKLSAENFTATADMEKNIKFGNLVGIDVTCNNRNIKSTDITKSRENVVISIEDASSEQFNIIVTTTEDEGAGYVVGTAIPERSLIQIDGPASVIAQIKRVVAQAKVTGFNSDRTVRCDLQLLDESGNKVDTTYLDYYGKTEGIDVHITMLKTKVVPLKVEYSGTPADGYSFQGISYKPETIEIAGTSADIASVSAVYIPEEAVDITGMSESTQLTVDITPYLPMGIRLKDPDEASVAVSVELEKKQGKTVKIPVNDIGLQNLPRGLGADYGDLDEVEIIVMGTSAELAQLNVDEIAVTLDLEGLTKEGSYTKVLTVTLPGTYTLMSDVEIDFKLVKATTGSEDKVNNSDTDNKGNTGNSNTGSNTGNNTGNNTGSNAGSSTSGSGNSGSTGNSGNAGTSGDNTSNNNDGSSTETGDGGSSDDNKDNNTEETE